MDTKAFKGLNDVSDPLRLGLGWFVQADNVDITDTGSVITRHGYALTTAGSYTAMFSTFDYQRCYVVNAGVLQTFEGLFIANLTSTATMYWTEVNDQVYFNNGTDSGVITPANTLLPWAWPTPNVPTVAAVTGNLPAGAYSVRCTYLMADGRETGTSDPGEITLDGTMALQISGISQWQGRTNVYIAPANSSVYQLAGTVSGSTFNYYDASNNSLGRDLVYAFMDPLPLGTTVTQFWKGAMYTAFYMAQQDATAVFFTEPLAFHLFNLDSNFFMVPGKVLMLAPTDDALIVATGTRMWTYDADAKLGQIAEYGVVPGQHWCLDSDEDGKRTILFWSTRGVCSGLPFTNLTERQVSVAPGLSAGGTVVLHGGQKRYVVALQQGGSAFDSYP